MRDTPAPFPVQKAVEINPPPTGQKGADSVNTATMEQKGGLTKQLPINERYMLTIKEAASYFNIGTKKLRRIAEDNLGTVAVVCGNRFLIVRPKFEEFILNSSEI